MRAGRRGVSLVAIAVVTAHCRTPTEIVVDLSTDAACADVEGVQILAGKTPSGAPHACAGEGARKALGSIVIYPSGAKDDVVTIEAHLSLGTSPTCNEGDPDCIVARRRLRYQPHTSLPLGIQLRQACAGHGCEVDETCVLGECVSADVQAPTFQDEGDAGISSLPDAASDAPAPADVEVPDTSPIDAGEDGPISINDAGSVVCATDVAPFALMQAPPTSFGMGGTVVIAGSDTEFAVFSRKNPGAAQVAGRTAPSFVAAHPDGRFALTQGSRLSDTRWAVTANVTATVAGLDVIGPDLYWSENLTIQKATGIAPTVTTFANDVFSNTLGPIATAVEAGSPVVYVGSGDSVYRATGGVLGSPFHTVSAVAGGPVLVRHLFYGAARLFVVVSDGSQYRLISVEPGGLVVRDIDLVPGDIVGLAATPATIYYTVQRSAAGPARIREAVLPVGPPFTVATPILTDIGGMTGDGACIYYGATSSAGTGLFRLIPN